MLKIDWENLRGISGKKKVEKNLELIETLLKVVSQNASLWLTR